MSTYVQQESQDAIALEKWCRLRKSAYAAFCLLTPLVNCRNLKQPITCDPSPLLILRAPETKRVRPTGLVMWMSRYAGLCAHNRRRPYLLAFIHKDFVSKARRINHLVIVEQSLPLSSIDRRSLAEGSHDQHPGVHRTAVHRSQAAGHQHPGGNQELHTVSNLPLERRLISRTRASATGECAWRSRERRRATETSRRRETTECGSRSSNARRGSCKTNGDTTTSGACNARARSKCSSGRCSARGGTEAGGGVCWGRAVDRD